MKMNKYIAIALGAFLAVGCSDFEDINRDPKAVNEADAEPYWALNKSIIADQQNPNDAERVFVLYWADLSRQDGESGSGRTVGRSNDEWVGCLYSLTNNCITSANTAIKLSRLKIETGTLSDRNLAFYKNIMAFARIWRVYLMTEFVDSFGSYTTDFESEKPEYKSVEECYNFMFAELKDAIPTIDVTVAAQSDLEKNGDPAYQYDPVKWKNFGVSMWMRIAMRLSTVNYDRAKEQFNLAVAAGEGIIDNSGNFGVQERSGWDDLSGVMSRIWDWQETSMTMANLMTNLGGADAKDILADPGHRFYASSPNVAEVYGPYIKDASNYLGVAMKAKDKDGKYGSMCEFYTDSPTQGYFFDGIPQYIDPRAFVYFCLPGDYDNRKESGYISFMRLSETTQSKVHINNLYKDEKNKIYCDDSMIETKFAFNGLPAGFGYDLKFAYFGPYAKDHDINQNGYGSCYPSLCDRYRNNTEKRLFFGAWETYFLKAEAVERKMISGNAEEFYNAGIKKSLEYLGVENNYDKYINSKNYNRVGTSVMYSHIDDPANFSADYYDPETQTVKKVEYKYPDKSKCLNTEGLNTKIAKIITQKYIANAPWMPLENWSDHRRTGLPFWEIPVASEANGLPNLENWTINSASEGQRIGLYPQRMLYPQKFKNANPDEYNHAIQLNGMSNDNVLTPLWWAIQK